MSFLVADPYFSLLQTWIKRKIFVSYHHQNDQWYYNEFSRIFSDSYNVIQDNSLDRVIDSDDSEYVMRRIREEYLTGSSCTFVLCGPYTPQRKFVDWEIKATLDKNHGLIGISLPNNPVTPWNTVYVPGRLSENIYSGYALWLDWNGLIQAPNTLNQFIEIANARSKTLIRNADSLKARNG